MNNDKPKVNSSDKIADEIEKQVQECLDKVDKAITGYHIAVRYLVLRRILTDETSIMNREYQWVDHWMLAPSKYDNMVI